MVSVEIVRYPSAVYASLRLFVVTSLHLRLHLGRVPDRRSNPPTPRALHLGRRRAPVVRHHVPSLAVRRPPPPRRRRQRRGLILKPAPNGMRRAAHPHRTRLVRGHGGRTGAVAVVHRGRRAEHRGGCRVGHDAVVDVPAGVRVAALDFSHIRLGRAQAPELCVKPRERRHERGLLHATPAAHAGIHVRRIVVPRVVVHGRTGWNREAVRVQPLERSQKFGLLQRQRRRGPRG
mmetsp:Transcript_7781/g.35296  ORF Transcript_7781/g.35296 Transcript_7781/m.35296 type:complete len:233 (-) Transcript_7781:3173-3871(-)